MISFFMIQFVTKEHAKKKKKILRNLPIASEAEKTGIQLYEELSELWHSAIMYPRKWLSNSRNPEGYNQELTVLNISI